MNDRETKEITLALWAGLAAWVLTSVLELSQ
jgi:hypothetical protein